MLTRRTLVAFLALCLVPVSQAVAEPAVMSAEEAHRKASEGELVLLDIRSPREWKQTGVGASAKPVSMHMPGFLRKIEEATGGDKSRPVAVMCASGGRSSAVAPKLAEAGYETVYNVKEGMTGGQHGQGWAPSGLPVEPYSPGQ